MALVDNTSIRRGGMAAIATAVVVTALVVASSVPPWAAAQPTASTVKAPAASGAAASARGHLMASRNGSSDVGIRAHGFVRDASGTFATIDVLGATSFTIVFGINNNGETAGGYVDAKGTLHGFLRRDGAVSTIDVPGAKGTFASRVNDVGQIVGAYSDEPNVPALKAPHGFLLDNGAFTKIDVPGASETRPLGINNPGQVVGEYVDDAGTSHGFLLDNGVFTTIDAPGGTSTWATDIDDSGRIVGISFGAANTVGGAVRGFVRDAQGVFTAIDAPTVPPPPGRPEGPQTQPFGLNNRGQITGVFVDAEGVHAFLLDNGVFTTIDAPDASGSTLVLDLNDKGQLVGAYDIEGHGYLQDRGGNFTTIDHPDGVEETVLTGINNRGQIVGGYLDTTGTLRGFLRDQQGFTTIDVPGALGLAASKINDHGQIVGAYSTLTNRNHAFPVHGYLLDKGVVTRIDVPGAPHTNPIDIDNHGQIVGEYQDAAGIPHGFLRDTNGSITNIDAPGATQGTLPLGINNQGEIVGSYFDDVRRRGFLLSNGTFTTTTAPGAFLETLPFDIDDRGQIVGFYF
jgi:probable HAF family extracellular repeat protein